MRYKNSWINATVVAIEQVAASVLQIQIQPASGTIKPYTVGSHINVSVLIDGKTEIRSYSLVGEYQSNASYIIAVKLLPSSNGGSKYMWSLKAGFKIRISQPTNNFELSHNTNNYLLIAAGIGITPIIGMAKILNRKAGLEVKMLYAGNNKEEMPYVNDLQSLLGSNLMLHYSDTQGFYDTSELINLANAKTQIYLCGPLPFMNAVRKTWEDGPYENSNLRFETFGASGLFEKNMGRWSI